MGRLILFGASVIAALLGPVAVAQAVKSVVVASNGVEVSVYSDEFANRYEYSAPTIKFDDGFALVASVKKGGVASLTYITGAMMYVGEWRRYNTALFRGGDAAKFVVSGRDVGRCYSSKYSRPSCSLNEHFTINLTADEIKKHSQNGVLAIQVRAEDSTTTIIEIPVASIDAVNEVAKR